MKKKVIIVGAGIVGATAAFYLSQQDNIDLTVIDAGNGTATRAAAGIICPWLSQRRNQTWYQLVSAGAAFYPRLMTALAEHGVTHLPYKQTGTLVFKNKPQLQAKLAKLANQRKMDAPMIGETPVVESAELHALIPKLRTDQGAILASGGGRVDGGLLLDQFMQIITDKGTRVVKGRAQLLTENELCVNETTYRFDQLILAAGAWLPELLAPLGYQVDVRPQKGQLLEVQTDWQTENWPGCMLHGEIDILPFENGRLVIGATHEDDQGFDLTVDTDKIQAMKATASEFMPDLQDLAISKIRVGTRAYTSDYSPFYGQLRNQPHIQVASGLGSSGLTSGPFIGWQLAQQIIGEKIDFDLTPYIPDKYIKNHHS